MDIEKIIDIEMIAYVCHEANRAYCATLGDYSQFCWLLAEDWQTQSAIAGVKFRLANPNAPPSAQHEAWMADKVKDGWKHGPVKDAEKKEHPCMVPYGELPEAQRAKDRLFVAIVDALICKDV